MASVAEFQARARERAAQATHNTPEITMENPPNPPEDDENTGISDDEATGDGMNTTQHGDIRAEVTRPMVTNAVRREDLTIDEVTRLIRRHGLPTAFLSDVQTFQRLPPSAQMVHIFLALQGIHSFIATLPRPDEWWRITALFENNLKTYTKALFVQATVKDYQSDTIIGYMEKIIKRLRWGLPPNAENNPELWKQILAMIRSVASDARGEWKKNILKSIENETHVSELAAEITSAIDGFAPDGPFLIRVAVLRTVCLRDKSIAYWPLVAKELEDIRNCNNPNQVLAEYFLSDQAAYPKPGMAPVTVNFTPTPSESSVIQAAGRLMHS